MAVTVAAVLRQPAGRKRKLARGGCCPVTA